MRPRLLPTAACPAATGTATAKASKPAASTKPAATAKTATAEAPTASAKNLREKKPEKNAAQGCNQDDQYDDDDCSDPANRQTTTGLRHVLSWSLW